MLAELTTRAASYFASHLSTVVGFVLALLLLSQILKEQRSTGATFAWILAIALIPYIGVPLYLMFGGRKLQRVAESKARLYAASQASRAPRAEASPVERVLCSFGAPPVESGNSAELLPTGEDAYRALHDLIARAERRVHVATFILGDDDAGNGLLSALTLRAAQGLEVRLLIDAMFSRRPSRARLAEFTRAGGALAFFMPMLHVLPRRRSEPRLRSNLRLHRKIAVADAADAIVGGMNLAHEYLGPAPDPARWRDLSLRVRGPAAHGLDRIFASDWAFAAGTAPPSLAAPASQGSAEMQVVASGPDIDGDTFYDAVLTGLFEARQRVWLVTPYFIPNEPLREGLELAVRRGVDVRIVVPHASNHRIADLAGAASLRQLAQAGVQVYRFMPSMLHAKVTVIDALAVVGSANIDLRSLFLNYEVALFLSSPAEVQALADWFLALLGECKTGLSPARRVRSLGEDLARLLAPLV